MLSQHENDYGDSRMGESILFNSTEKASSSVNSYLRGSRGETYVPTEFIMPIAFAEFYRGRPI